MNLSTRLRHFRHDFPLWLTHGTPRPFSTLPPMSDEAKGWLAQLNEKGVAVIDHPAIKDVARYISEFYFGYLEGLPEKQRLDAEFFELDKDRFLKWSGRKKKENQQGGTRASFSVSFKDKQLAPLLLSPDILGVFYHYYGRQPYYRNETFIHEMRYAGVNPLNNGSFHTDQLKQVSMMLLVSDVTEADTHMELAVGSHRRPYLWDGISLDAQEATALLNERQYELMHCVGKQGTLFIFDSIAIHRAAYKPGTVRRILHANINTGARRNPFIDDIEHWPGLSEYPDFVGKAFER